MKTKPPVFKEESNPRLFVVRFDNWIKLEGIDDQKAALAFKNAIEDEIVLLQLSRLPEDIKNSYEKLREQFIVTNDSNSEEFYKKTLTESLKQKDRESVRNYQRRIYANSNINKEEHTMVTEFVRGLLPNIKYKILSDTEAPENMSQALRAARKWEDIYHEERIHVSNININQEGVEDKKNGK